MTAHSLSQSGVDQRLSGPRYSILKPDPRLADYVASIWVQEVRWMGHDTPTLILPDGSADLVFEFGEPFRRVDDYGETLLPPQMILGPRTRPFAVRATGDAGLVIVRFFPWGAAALLGSLNELADDEIDLGAVAGSERARLVGERVWGSRAERVRVVEKFLIDRLPRRLPDRRVRVAIERLQRVRGSATVASLAREVGVSRRHLVRLFREQVGLTPKVMARVVRFQHVTALRRRGWKWSVAAAACGYADQAHLAREVRTITGLTPSQVDQRGGGNQLTRTFNGTNPAKANGTMYL